MDAALMAFEFSGPMWSVVGSLTLANDERAPCSWQANVAAAALACSGMAGASGLEDGAMAMELSSVSAGTCLHGGDRHGLPACPRRGVLHAPCCHHAWPLKAA